MSRVGKIAASLETRGPSTSPDASCPYASHRDPVFWPDPERFDPDRWLPEAEAKRNPYTYHPFASGKRICIGNSFSLFESHIITAVLASRYQPRLLPGHQPKFEMAGTLNVSNGLPMIIEERKR